MVHTVTLIIPKIYANGFNDPRFKIIDAPGLDDSKFREQYTEQIKYFNFKIVPIIVFSLE